MVTDQLTCVSFVFVCFNVNNGVISMLVCAVIHSIWTTNDVKAVWNDNRID